MFRSYECSLAMSCSELLALRSHPRQSYLMSRARKSEESTAWAMALTFVK